MLYASFRGICPPDLPLWQANSDAFTIDWLITNNTCENLAAPRTYVQEHTSFRDGLFYVGDVKNTRRESHVRFPSLFFYMLFAFLRSVLFYIP